VLKKGFFIKGRKTPEKKRRKSEKEHCANRGELCGTFGGIRGSYVPKIGKKTKRGSNDIKGGFLRNVKAKHFG